MIAAEESGYTAGARSFRTAVSVDEMSMTEWNAPGYARIGGLQEAMAAEVLGNLELTGNERVLDLGCGNGKVTAEIAARVPDGLVLGVDASSEMIAFATTRLPPDAHPNLHFETCDIRRISLREKFDLVVSFNALHWLRDQGGNSASDFGQP